MANNDSSIYRTGDIVIGSTDPAKSVYSANGAKILSDGVSVYGSEKDLMARQLDIAKLAIRSGGTPLKVSESLGKKQAKKKQPKKPIKADTSFEDYVNESFARVNSAPEQYEPSMKELISVQFENDFGKIKAKVEDLVEHELAFLLIFSDEDAVVFEPKVGEMLLLHTPGKQKFEVYYPGVTFDSPDNNKKLMVLFKVPADNQE